MKNNKNSAILAVHDWIDTLARESLRIIEQGTDLKDGAKLRTISSKLLRFYVEALVTQALNEKPTGTKVTKDEKYRFVEKNFAQIKYDIQNEVATGFSHAISRWSKKQHDYYCVVKPTPDPVNKEPC